MCNKLIYRISFVLLFGLFTGAADANITSALVAYYPLDGDAMDATGNGHDGTIIGDPQTIPGMFGQALEFDGVDDYILVTDYVPVSGAADRAVTAWIRMVNTDVQGIVAWGQIQGQSKWVIRLTPKGQLRLEIEGAAIKGNSRLADGEWHHIAVSFANDGTPALGDVDLYADGTLQNHANETLQINTSPTGNLEIGRNLKNDGFFEGSIDEVKIYDRALSVDEVFEDMEGPPSYSFTDNPNPADGTVDVPRNAVLRWTPSNSTNTHDVYFGTNPDDVSEADITNPLGVVVSQNQDANNYDPPGLLDFGQTYYWRVDEINAPPDLTVFKGDVWQFTVEPFAYPVKNITAMASSNTPDRGPENTVNGSGLDESGLLHDKIADGAMWLSSLNADQPTWINYEFGKVHKLHEMWVWNSNDSLEPAIGFGFKDVTIEYSVNDTDYTTLGTTHEFARAPGLDDYAHNTTVDLNGAAAKYVRLTANSNWGSILDQYGLSEVRFFYIPILAREPNPDSGARDVSIGTIDEPIDVTLGFRAGREAARHDVYLSSDEQAVIDGTAPVATVTETSYGPLSLDLGMTYYWRVDEVNDAETPTTWKGDLWDFRTQEYFVVDDFEDYNDYPPDEIFSTWIDGYGTTTNGSTAGYAEPDFLAGEHYVETTIVHSGSQSMPLFYDNNFKYSEATMTLSSQRDWTIRGVGVLSLWFYGDTSNAAEPMYVALNGSAVVYHDDPDAALIDGWTEWTIDLQEFAAQGVNLANVNTIAIGYGDKNNLQAGGSGMVFFDDIRLYRPAQ